MSTIQPDLRIIGATTKQESAARATALRCSRRVSDKILIAAHHACDIGDVEVAQHLVFVAEKALRREHPIMEFDTVRCRERVVAALERVWHLKHPEFEANRTIGAF
jgi:hypothetical protein